MTLNEFGRFLNTKSIGRVEPPVNEQLTERVFTAMKKIGFRTIPLKWAISDSYGYEVLRRVDENTYIRMPHKPVVDSGEQLDIEESLLDALALYVMAGLEPQRAKLNMGMFYEEVEQYNDNLTQTYLEEATNDAERFYQFP